MKLIKDQCPFCESGQMIVKDSRPTTDDDVFRRRRRECNSCKKRVTTHEVIIGEVGIGWEQAQRLAVRFLDRIEVAAKDVYGDEFRHFARRQSDPK